MIDGDYLCFLLNDKKQLKPTVEKMKKHGYYFYSFRRFRSKESPTGYFFEIEFEKLDHEPIYVTRHPDITEDEEFGTIIFDLDKNKQLTLTVIRKNPIYYEEGNKALAK